MCVYIYVYWGYRDNGIEHGNYYSIIGCVCMYIYIYIGVIFPQLVGKP